MKIALATDHTGLELLKAIQAHLTEQGHDCHSFAPTSLDPGDDYPDFIRPAAEAVSKGDYQMGIILGGSGQGEAMVANRVPGVRAAVYYGPAHSFGAIDADGSQAEDQYEILRLSREHNDANILSLAARFLSRADALAAVDLWLHTPFSGAERHQRRIKKIDGDA